MKASLRLLIVHIVLIATMSFVGAQEAPRRIVSMSPAITEILYELKLKDNVVGVTDYCFFPDDAKNKAKVGGYLNPNYEAILSLKPDLVIFPVDYGDEMKRIFDQAKVRYMTVKTFTVVEIFDTIRDIGIACNKEREAEDFNVGIRSQLQALKDKVKSKGRKRIMIVVGRESGSFENIYIAGKGTFYNELLETLGLVNVCNEHGIKYPNVSLEAILRLDPDIIIEMIPNCPESRKSLIISEWNSLTSLSAVKNKKVFVINSDYACIPGPRFILILKDIEATL